MTRFASLLAAAAIAVSSTTGSAQVYIVPPTPTQALLGRDDQLIAALPGATPQELTAARMWALRSGLNVAALQCSTSPFLDTTANYNDLLRDHREELAAAYTAFSRYFTRTVAGKAALAALNAFDTRSYNGWSTIYGQRGFCNAASRIGKALRFVPNGALPDFAEQELPGFRASLIPLSDPLLSPPGLVVALPVIPDFPPSCYDKRGAVKAKCLR